MTGQKFGPAWFPGLIASGLILCGALLVLSRLRAADHQPKIELPAWMRRRQAVAAVCGVIGGLLIYVFVVDTAGFHLTAAVLLLAWSRLLGASWRLAIPVSLTATILIHLA